MDEHAAIVAIVAFWKLDEKKVFKCYRHFKVANPITRVVRQDQDLVKKAKHFIHDMLFESNKEVFFFFHKTEEDTPEPKTKRVILGRINLSKSPERGDSSL